MIYMNKSINHQYDSETAASKNYLSCLLNAPKIKSLFKSLKNIYLSKFYKVILRIKNLFMKILK